MSFASSRLMLQSRMGAMTSNWMGVGSVYPMSSSARETGAETATAPNACSRGWGPVIASAGLARAACCAVS